MPYKSTDQAVKMTGLITGSRKAIETHKHSPEVHAMPKPGPGVRTNARVHYLCSLEFALTSRTHVCEVVKNIMNCEKNNEL